MWCPSLPPVRKFPEAVNSINEIVARVAYDYQVPLWNFGVSVLPLPSYGLTADGFHLSQAGNFFDNPDSMKAGWPWRNLTALEAIDAVYRAVSGQPKMIGDMDKVLTLVLVVRLPGCLRSPRRGNRGNGYCNSDGQEDRIRPPPRRRPPPLRRRPCFPARHPILRLSPEDWQDWPVVPTVSPEMKAVYQRGLALGNNPAAFSKIGDGEISTVWFLTQYDMGPGNYHLGSHTELLPVIEHFSGSFGRVGSAAGRGYNTTIILGPVPAGTKGCNPGESHLDCELRVYHPSFAIISLGTNQVWQPEVFEPGLRQIIERLLQAEVVPILSTKADNLEGNYRINTHHRPAGV